MDMGGGLPRAPLADFTLGYYLSGFQPIQFEPRDLGSIDEWQIPPRLQRGGSVILRYLLLTTEQR